MALKRIEINGFKSFADKTEIVLAPGVTVVVGPNGSGKSNISDAVRWVLGEQSPRSLRGAKMEDVIFAGTDRRRPVGMAEVSITLDNEAGLLPVDFREVTVTRRVYRSGESEYLLNRRACRLKDLHDLFADTGLGKEGLSIIGQGRVDEVLSSRPEERRALIEEAAGIVRYRNRKREAVKKMEETKGHLMRLNDILTELAGQTEAVTEQAGRARRFLELDQRRAKWELSLCIADEEEITGRLQAQLAEVEKMTAALWAKQASLSGLDAQEEELAAALKQAEEVATAARQAVHEQTEIVLELQRSLDVVRERQHGLVANQELQERELAKANIAEAELLERQASLEEQEQGTTENLLIAEREVKAGLAATSAQRAALTSAEQTVETDRQLLFSLAQQLAQLRNAVHDVELAWTRCEAGSQRVEAALTEAVEQRSRLSAALETADACLATLGQQQREGEEARAALRQHLEVNARRLRDGEQEHTQTLRRWQETTARQKALDAMDKAHEGFALGVREILDRLRENHRALRGIHGVVADLITVPVGLEVAIEVALGGGMQNLVVADDDAAQRGIAHLKQVRKGRATFLPLTSLRPSSGPNGAILQSPGVLGCAADLVSSEERFLPALRFLLGRTIVMQDLPSALALARQTGHQWRIVTVEGELLQPGGSVTGGSLGQRGGQTFLRRRELQELAEREKDLAATVKALSQERQAIEAEQQSLQQQLQEREKTMQELLLTYRQQEAEKAQLQQQYQQALWQEEARRGEAAMLQAEREQLAQARQEATAALAAKQAENEAVELRRETERQRLEQLRASGDRDRERLAEWQMTLARVQAEIKGIEAARATLQGEWERLRAQKDEKATSCRQLTEAIEKCRQEIAQLEAKHASAMLVEREREAVAGQAREKQHHLQELLNGVAQQRRPLAAEVATLRDALHQAEVKAARQEAEVTAIRGKLQDSLGVSLEEARGQAERTVDRRTMQKSLALARDAIQQLGPVNLLAIEEEERLQGRYSFLVQQQADLLAAKDTLEQVIREMEAIMIKRFREAFAQINRQFGSVFTDLFHGGQAELVLTNPDDLLETGVDIIAQPPGKKRVFLSLLSGGERAMTAIALLFSLLIVRPSPFCVLDEIEAALDEVNVHRFGRYLKTLATQSQFIVISHRKGTMEAADYLYGVTQEEAGISRLISVKLSESGKNEGDRG